jgi:HEAT repeat protein
MHSTPRPYQPEGEEMLSVSELHQHILILAGSDDAAKRLALQSLRLHDENDWSAIPVEATHSLVEALQGELLEGTKQPFLQKDIATILGNIGPRAKPALPQLIALLHKDISDSVREAAAIALGKIGNAAKAAVGALVELLKNARPTLTAQAVRALGAIGSTDGKVRSALANLWTSCPQLQSSTAQVAIALCKLHVPAPNLLESLTTTLVTCQDVSHRKAAAEALAWCGKNEPDVVPALLTASLSDANEDVRQMAQAGLDQMHLSHEKAIDVCARQFGVSSHAEAALRKCGLLAVAPMIEALGAEEAAIRLQAARILGCLGKDAADAAIALTKALHDKDLDVRLTVAKSLWSITKTPDDVVPALADMLKVKWTADLEDSENRRRYLQTVMEALIRIGPPALASVTALTALTKDNNRHIREAALLTLQKIAPK